MPDFDDGCQRVAVKLFDDEQLGLGRYRCFLGFVAELAAVGGVVGQSMWSSCLLPSAAGI